MSLYAGLSVQTRTYVGHGRVVQKTNKLHIHVLVVVAELVQNQPVGFR